MGTAPRLLAPDAEERLATEGWAVVPVLTPEEVAALREGYRELVPSGEDGLVVEYAHDDRARMRALAALLVPVLDRRLADLVDDHRIVFASFVVKHPGHRSAMFLHDDRTYVDERRHRSLSLWVPLVDVSPQRANGALQVVPGSHRLARGPSGSRTPEHFRPYERTLRRGLVGVSLRAGEGAVYDSRLLHASPANLDREARVAVVCAIAPREARLIHVVGAGPRRREVHAVDEAFFVEHSPQSVDGDMPAAYPVVATFDDDAPPLAAGEVAAVAGVAVDQVERDALVPPDLEPLARTGTAVEPADRPVRVGALVIAPGAATVPDRPTGGLDHVAAAAATAPSERWVPATLGLAGLVRWVVGDPRVLADGSGDAVLLRVAPDERLALVGPVTIEVVEAPPLGAGVVAAGSAADLATGRAVTVAGDLVVVWDHGPGSLLAVVAPAGRRRWWRSRRARRLRGEAAMAQALRR